MKLPCSSRLMKHLIFSFADLGAFDSYMNDFASESLLLFLFFQRHTIQEASVKLLLSRVTFFMVDFPREGPELRSKKAMYMQT